MTSRHRHCYDKYIYVNSSTRRLRAAVLPLIPARPSPLPGSHPPRRAAPRHKRRVAARSHSGPVCRPSVGRSLHTRITITHRITSQIAHKYHTARSARFVRLCLGRVARNPPPRRRRGAGGRSNLARRSTSHAVGAWHGAHHMGRSRSVRARVHARAPSSAHAHTNTYIDTHTPSWRLERRRTGEEGGGDDR